MNGKRNDPRQSNLKGIIVSIDLMTGKLLRAGRFDEDAIITPETDKMHLQYGEE